MAQNISLQGAVYSAVPSVLLPKQGGGTASFTDVTDTTAAAADVASGKYFYTAAGVRTAGTASGGGASWTVKTATKTASNYPTSLGFTIQSGLSTSRIKALFVKLATQVSSSGNTTYYYIVDVVYNGTNTHGNCFRVGSTRRVDTISSGYSFSISGTTLTVTSSAASRSASPGAFYNGSYELTYIYE